MTYKIFTISILFMVLSWTNPSLFAQSSTDYSVSAKHCLLGDTKITMYDDSMKDISDIEEGDIILSYNPTSREYEETAVIRIHKVMQNRLLKINTNSGAYIEVTADQPFWGLSGWMSMNPIYTQTYKRYENVDVKQLDASSELYFYDITQLEETKVVSIEGFIKVVETYSLELENEGAYIANSFIVGQE